MSGRQVARVQKDLKKTNAAVANLEKIGGDLKKKHGQLTTEFLRLIEASHKAHNKSDLKEFQRLDNLRQSVAEERLDCEEELEETQRKIRRLHQKIKSLKAELADLTK